MVDELDFKKIKSNLSSVMLPEIIDDKELYFEDDENIYFKQRIAEELFKCDELFYALHLTDKSGNRITTKDDYFGSERGIIYPFLMIPNTQTSVENFLCFTTNFNEIPKYNKIMKYGQITFTIMCREESIIDHGTNLPRHDLIASIIRRKFNWSQIFGMQCHLVSNKESTTDTNYATRSLIFELTLPNGIIQTTKTPLTDERKTMVINRDPTSRDLNG